jgi:hypothetical protein
LFALIRMDQQNDFVVTHKLSFWMTRRQTMAAESGESCPQRRTGCSKASL